MDENAQKQRTDELAGALLELDKAGLKREAQEAADLLKKLDRTKVFVTGGAGSGKTTFSAELAQVMDIPHFDLDNYVKGGFVRSKGAYTQRFMSAVYNLWSALPGDGWIVEHVEMGRPDIMQAFQPQAIVFLKADEKHLKSVAAGRAVAAGEPNAQERETRALETADKALKWFDDLSWREVKTGNWRMKIRPD